MTGTIIQDDGAPLALRITEVRGELEFAVLYRNQVESRPFLLSLKEETALAAFLRQRQGRRKELREGR